MDGLVTNTALVAGVGGGGAAPRAIVLAGVASLVAGAISMALGEYTSVKTQNEQLDLEVEKERRELERNPEGELAELDRDAAGPRASTTTWPSAVAAQLSRDPETALRLHVVAELGLNPEDKPSPRVAAVSSFLTFAVGRAAPAAALPVRRLAAVGGAGRAAASACSWPGRSPPASPRGRGGTPACASCSSVRSPPAITYAIGAAIGVAGDP